MDPESSLPNSKDQALKLSTDNVNNKNGKWKFCILGCTIFIYDAIVFVILILWFISMINGLFTETDVVSVEGLESSSINNTFSIYRLFHIEVKARSANITSEGPSQHLMIVYEWGRVCVQQKRILLVHGSNNNVSVSSGSCHSYQDFRGFARLLGASEKLKDPHILANYMHETRILLIILLLSSALLILSKWLWKLVAFIAAKRNITTLQGCAPCAYYSSIIVSLMTSLLLGSAMVLLFLKSPGNLMFDSMFNYLISFPLTRLGGASFALFGMVFLSFFSLCLTQIQLSKRK